MVLTNILDFDMRVICKSNKRQGVHIGKGGNKRLV